MKIFVDALSRIPTVSIGTQALIIGCLQILGKQFPTASFVMLSSLPKHERTYLDSTGFEIEYVERSPSQWVTIRQFRDIVKRVDAVASAWGDGYVSSPSRSLLQKSLAIKRRGVPLILVTASVGPFRSAVDRLMARWGLSLFDVLTVREPNSKKYVEGLGLRDVRCLPDTAFVLDSADDAAVDDILGREGIPVGAPLIGVNPSILLHHRFPQATGRPYAPDMAGLVEHLRRITGLPIVLVPHQIYPAGFPGLTQEMRLSPDGDDRAAAQMILDAMGDRTGVYCLMGDYPPSVYKGVLQKCEMFIGGRMHSVISAASAGTPSVIMQYSHKASGVMGMLGLSEFVWDCKQPLVDLLGLAERALGERAQTRAALARTIPGIVAEAYTVGELFAAAAGGHSPP